MSNLSRTPVQSRNTLDPRSYDSDVNSGELVDRLRQDEDILRVHVDLISRTPNHIRFDETEPDRASVPNQGTAAISAIPMETINLLLAQMVGMMQKFDDRLRRYNINCHPQWRKLFASVATKGNWMRGLGE